MSNKTVKMPIGMRKSYFFPFATEPASGHPTYAGLVDMGAARKGYLSVTTSSLEIPGDDVLQVWDEQFVSGQADVETDCSDLELNATVYGHSYANGVETSNKDDRSPLGGYAFIEPILLKDTSVVYRATFLYKVCAMQSAEKVNADTKPVGNLDPKVNAVSFKVMADATGDWRDRQEFSTEAQADAWLRGKGGASGVWPVTITNVGGHSTPDAGVHYATAGQSFVIDYGTTDPVAVYDNGTLKTLTSHKLTLTSLAAAHSVVAIWS